MVLTGLNTAYTETISTSRSNAAFMSCWIYHNYKMTTPRFHSELFVSSHSENICFYGNWRQHGWMCNFIGVVYSKTSNHSIKFSSI